MTRKQPVKLRRIGKTETKGGCEYRCYYETQDGRFTIDKTWSAGWLWQIRATDGSKPFHSRWGGNVINSEYFNADTLTECREELEGIYESEED